LSDKDFCLQKLNSAIATVARLLDGDYLHTDSKQALNRILSVYQADKKLLESLDSTAQHDTVLEHCRRVNIDLVRFKAFLGLLIRSSNIRNAFELYFPIKILALELLEKPTSVVLSSEWAFSPYTYPVALTELPEFIFIGVPASESQNPLIMPLAGHELGHVVWQRKGAKKEFDSRIRTEIIRLYTEKWTQVSLAFNIQNSTPDKLETDLFLRGIWAQSYRLAQRQLEEVFCDYVGLYVFGASFLHSFRYLVAPSLGYHRSFTYPKLKDRARYMEHMAGLYQIPPIAEYVDSFSEQDHTLAPGEKFILEAADSATEKLFKELPALVVKYRGRAECFKDGEKEEAFLEQHLKSLVPVASARSMAAVVNAAWKIRLQIDGWPILNDIEDDQRRRDEKLRVLRDLVLKSFEVYEYRKRLEKYRAKKISIPSDSKNAS
jgi:hypothetical protein